MIREFVPKILAGVDCFYHSTNAVVHRCQTNIVYLHDITGIRASKESNCNAEPGFGVDEIPALILLPIATTVQKEHPFKMRFQNFK